MDSAFWKEYAEEISLDAELWTSSQSAADLFQLNLVHTEPGAGVSKRPGLIRHGGNSGFLAVGLALYFGAARIVLLGYDMQLTNRKTHFHGDHPNHIGNPMRENLKRWARGFAQMAKETDVPIVNATRETALDCFPRMPLSEALA